MLTKAQCCRVDDQRGLLTKEQLEIPSFLQLSSDQRQDTDDPNKTSASTTDSKVESEGNTLTPGPAGAAKENPDSTKSETKDVRETAV